MTRLINHKSKIINHIRSSSFFMKRIPFQNTDDPVLRNLQITQSYYELSLALTARTGFSANWCTFATWASKQAGQSIRKEDLRRTLEEALKEMAEALRRLQEQAVRDRVVTAERDPRAFETRVKQALDFRLAVDRVSDAVGRGNKKVFEEIGREFARFEAGLLHDTQPDLDKLERFCASLRPGEPPDGQRYLSQAFRRYYQSFFVGNAKRRAELLLTANLEIGYHEQTRLQPEIAEALEAGLGNITVFAGRVLAVGYGLAGWLAFSKWLGRRLLGRVTAFDQALQELLAAARRQVRRAITETMMTIHLPPDLLVKLGDDLVAGFPETLRRPVDPDLITLLAQIDRTPDSPAGSGALDWASLPDRLNFICDLFRCYQESRDLFDVPFSPEQAAEIKAGRFPGGRL
jgi:hypothetical protein